MICPLCRIGGNVIQSGQYCMCGQCAWWSADMRKCAVLVIAEKMKKEKK